MSTNKSSWKALAAAAAVGAGAAAYYFLLRRHHEKPPRKTMTFGALSDVKEVPPVTVAAWHQVIPSMRTYTSATVSAKVATGLQRLVSGLESMGVKFQDIVAHIKSGNHTAFVYGGFLRDLVVGNDADDVDMLFTCPVEFLVDLAEERKWQYYLKVDEKTQRVRDSFIAIGDKGAKSKFSGHTKGAGCEGDFAMNAMLFEVTHGVLIDPTGHGMADAVNRVLRIPCPPAEWSSWVASDRLFGMRVFRLFNFVSRGFKPADDATLVFCSNVLTAGFADPHTKVTIVETFLVFVKRKVMVKSVTRALERESAFRGAVVDGLDKAASLSGGAEIKSRLEPHGGAAGWYAANLTTLYSLVKKDSIPGLKRALAAL